jgi:hypothetical protein
MKINDINESSTTSGAIAPVAAPMTKMQTRTVGQGVYGAKGRKPGNLFTGKKTNKPFANSISEGKMKDIAYDLDNLSSGAFQRMYKQSKDEMRASLGSPTATKSHETVPKFTTKQQVIDHFVKIGKTKEQGARAWDRGYRGKQAKPIKEEELAEDDVIIVPGMRKSKDKSFVPHKEDRRDHEVQMARSDLYATAKNAMRIFDLLKERSEDQGIMGWQQSYITLAADYLNSVAESMEYEAQSHESTGGVIAGGGVGEGVK